MSDSVIVTIGAPDNNTAVSVSSGDRIFVDIAAGFTGQSTGGGGNTDLTTTRTATTVTVVSSTGTDATIPAADGTNAGVMTSAMQTKLAGIEAGAEVNDTASEILTKLLTVDGPGSNLDADTLDGVHASALVPYTGASQDVNLGEYAIKAGQINLDTSPTGTAAVGTTRWNDTIGSSETTLKGGNVILKNGVDLVVRVVNKVTPNTTLTKAAYQAVRVSGAQGQRLAVALAQANNDNNSADTIGLVIETIPTNQEGFIMTVGQLHGINTTGSLQGETWVDGDVIYLSPTTAGALTNVKPVAPNHIVIIGYVEYAHAVNGKIYVKVMNGWELGELHDVDTTESKTTPVDADAVLLQDSADSSIWKRLTWANLKATAKAYFDSLYVAGNTAITGATKTKITYDAKGLVTSGADATTADIADSTNKRYVTDAQLTVIGNTSGTNTGDQTITLTGDVTGSGTGSFAATIASNAVTNAKLAQVATATFKGRTTAGTGNVEDLTATQATALLNNFTSTLKGLAPASGGGTTNFLRADGTWAAPPAGGAGDATTLYENFTQVGVANSTTKTAIVSYTLPTDLVAGDMIEVHMSGTYKNNSGASRNFNITHELGATTMLTQAVSLVVNADERTWNGVARLYIVSTTAQRYGYFGLGSIGAVGTMATASTASIPMNGTGYGTASETITSAKTYQVAVAFATASADLFLYCQSVKIVKIAAA